MKGTIYLEDGTVYKGKGFGFEGTRTGELVFNTAMTGYQKTLTDPSYKAVSYTHLDVYKRQLQNRGLYPYDDADHRFCHDICTESQEKSDPFQSI